ncbi:aldehyde dehydrogenase family protein [Burkholderia lata]|uniref:aldehyde dehydrogenase family protein n=1 Tax=Burkholderia lata (strain ATCC 17760 / DSM 23089 / LMG 22485 / NCIMB 9086 / R18194 / 383) TaxID=482957 RepID=UPI001C2EC46A
MRDEFVLTGPSRESNSRLLLLDYIYDDVLARVVERVAPIRAGDPMSPDTSMGPINPRKRYDHVMSFFESAQTHGARLMTGGSSTAATRTSLAWHGAASRTAVSTGKRARGNVP